jgi:hypothetical protein
VLNISGRSLLINSEGVAMFGYRKVAGVIAGAVMALGAAAANAYSIDFTKANTGATGTLFGGSVTWNMTASGPLNNSQAFDGKSSAATAASGLAFETDGYGVGVKDDEITTFANGKQEWIKVAFSTPVLVDALYFLDLFVAKDGSSQEVAMSSINGGFPIVSTYATDVIGNKRAGFASSTFAPILVSEIFFTIMSTNDNVGFADGALAGIGLAPVPVPAAGLLLLGGLGGIAAVRRKRKAA